MQDIEFVKLAAVLVFGLVLCSLVAKCFRTQGEDNLNRVVVVTGAASGIGKAIVKELLHRGDLCVALDIDKSALAELGEESGDRLCGLQCDVRDFPACSKAASKAKQWLGGRSQCIDAVVNCAGVIRGGPLVEMKEDDVRLVMDVNVMGTVHTTKAFFPLLKRAGVRANPKIINIASEVSDPGRVSLAHCCTRTGHNML